MFLEVRSISEASASCSSAEAPLVLCHVMNTICILIW